MLRTPSTPGAGTPATRKPAPPKKACRSAMPMTPRDTLRIIAPASCTNSLPRRLSIRPTTTLRASAICGPRANRKPAMTIGGDGKTWVLLVACHSARHSNAQDARPRSACSTYSVHWRDGDHDQSPVGRPHPSPASANPMPFRPRLGHLSPTVDGVGRVRSRERGCSIRE